MVRARMVKAVHPDKPILPGGIAAEREPVSLHAPPTVVSAPYATGSHPQDAGPAPPLTLTITHDQQSSP
jgi:hypothetical protein